MSVTTVYAAEIIDTMAERWNLDQFTRTPIYIHGEVDDELVGWLEGQLPTNGYPCEHMGMGDEGNTACWSATEINRLRDENDKLRKLVQDMYACISYANERRDWHDFERDALGCGMSCTVNGESCGLCVLVDRMRELGVEVEE